MLSSGLGPAKALFGGPIVSPQESTCLWLCTCSSLGTQTRSPLGSQHSQERSRAAHRAYLLPQRVSPLVPICLRAKTQTRRFHFPAAVLRAGAPRFLAQFFRPFTRLLLAWGLIMLKKPKSSTSRRSNETDFPEDLFLLLERLFKLN